VQSTCTLYNLQSPLRILRKQKRTMQMHQFHSSALNRLSRFDKSLWSSCGSLLRFRIHLPRFEHLTGLHIWQNSQLSPLRHFSMPKAQGLHKFRKWPAEPMLGKGVRLTNGVACALSPVAPAHATPAKRAIGIEHTPTSGTRSIEPTCPQDVTTLLYVCRSAPAGKC